MSPTVIHYHTDHSNLLLFILTSHFNKKPGSPQLPFIFLIVSLCIVVSELFTLSTPKGDNFISRCSVLMSVFKFYFSLIDYADFQLFRSAPFTPVPFCEVVSDIGNTVINRLFWHILHSIHRSPDFLNYVFKICIHLGSLFVL